jgi:thiol:disulfide interchange protein
MRYLFLSLLGISILLGAGCSPATPTALPSSSVPQETPPKTDTKPAPAPSPTPAPTPSPATYEEYSPSAYAKARAEGRPVFLNFYASWCPFCKEQEPRLRALFENGKFPPGIRAFLVHYNDAETDADDKAIAKEFGVTYQHTYIFLNADGTEAKRTTGTTTDEAFLAHLQLIAN